jgi:hypothetical protein
MDDDTEQLAAYHLWLLLQEPWIFVRWHDRFSFFQRMQPNYVLLRKIFWILLKSQRSHQSLIESHEISYQISAQKRLISLLQECERTSVMVWDVGLCGGESGKLS